MARYIDVEAVGIGKAKRELFVVPEYADGWNNAIEIFENAPTADVVEVVRCKDCEYSREQDKVFGITDYKCSKHNISCLSPYDFCSYGERK